LKLNGASIVVETLINHDVTDVFGFPGGAVLHLYDALYKRQDKIKHHISCHEQGAAHAADGYSRSTGKTGVVIATSGPGATNLVTGIATAYLDSVPLVAITGNVALNLIGKDSFQEVDIAGITLPITKHNYIVKDVGELEDILCEAFQIAKSGRPGPVLIDIPKDIQAQEFEFSGGYPRALFPEREISEASLSDAAKLINQSQRPFIYAGGGVSISAAFEKLKAFSDKIDAPIGTSMMGLSSVNYKNPHMLGMTGMHGSYAASKMKSESDLIIGIGVRFSDRATGNKEKYQENAKIIHIDIDNSEIDKNIRTDVHIIGDIKKVLDALTPMVNFQDHNDWNLRAVKYKATGKEIQNTETNPFTPRKIIKTVRKYATDNTVIATDVGQHQMWVAQHYDFANPRTLLTSGGLGTMGFGVGAAIGASIAHNKKRTVLFTGDGSFHMNMNEMATAVMHNIPIIVIILNNRVLGMVRQWQGIFYGNRFSNTTMNRQTDYVKLAEAFGAVGFKVTALGELEMVLQQAFSETRPVIIDCLIDRDEKVLPMIPPGGSIDNIILN